MIQVGINENVVLTGVTLNDKNTLAFTFQSLDKAGDDKPSSPFDVLNSEEVVEIDNGTTVNLFQPNVPDKADMTQEKKVDMVTNDINKERAILNHFLRGFMTADELKGKLMPFAGVAIDKDNYSTQILNKDIVAAIHKNLATTFIQLITPFLAEKKPFRLLLVRQSTDKHWPTFRGKYVEENPFWESMEIPKEASKVAFTSYEKGQKLDDPTPSVTKPKAEGAAAAEQAPMSAANVFGGG